MRININNKKRSTRKQQYKTAGEKEVLIMIAYIRHHPASFICTVKDIRKKIVDERLNMEKYEATLVSLETKEQKAIIRHMIGRIKRNPSNCLFTIKDVQEHLEKLNAVLPQANGPSLIILSYEAQLRTLKKKVVKARVKRYIGYIREQPGSSMFELHIVEEWLMRAKRIGLNLSIYENKLPALKRIASGKSNP